MYPDRYSSCHDSDSLRVRPSSPGTVYHRTQPMASHHDSPAPVHASRISGFDPPVGTLRSKLSIEDLLNHGGFEPGPKPSLPSEATAPRGFHSLTYQPETTPNVFKWSPAFQDRVTEGTGTQDRDRGRRPHWRSVFRPYVPPTDRGSAGTSSRLPEKRCASRSPPGVEEQWRARRRSEKSDMNDEGQDVDPHLDQQGRFRYTGECEGKTMDTDTDTDTIPVRPKWPSRTEEQREAAAALAVRRRQGDRVQLELLKLKVASAEEGGKYNNSTVLVAANGYIDQLEEKPGTIQSVADNDGKSAILARAFFPPPPPTSTIDPDFEYPEPLQDPDFISPDQIRRHASKLSPYKAPGPDGIPNIVLTRCIEQIIDHLYYIFRATFALKVYYNPWREFTTVVLRKPNKPRYDLAKAYRPIALLNTTCKLLTSIVAEELTFLGEHHGLLPANHFGGRPGCTTTDAMHLLTQRVKNAWRQGNVVSALFLDIEGAFPNAVTPRLLHNLRKRQVPMAIINFVGRMLHGRSTKLRFDDYTSPHPIEISNGIGQGDPLSMILYLYYNADLLDIPQNHGVEDSMAYVDDAILIAVGKTFEDTHQIIGNMMDRPGGAVKWSDDHNSRFEFSKLALVDFASSQNKKTRPDLILHPPNSPPITIKPASSTRYLGIILDQSLIWREQWQNAVARGTTWTQALRRLA
ncbi:hypothetical protein EVG20_g6603 [Dentipellis fragilis]|uniref:Reverse transcriptase domain-containing protein n=1 Tax=Dentipellis fragilis TaxID=205917 RepID=A0A4Y9YL73_9AGAM|nr:hypothetical protein EVG20_g6603 [Dentipellis fragilis]